VPLANRTRENRGCSSPLSVSRESSQPRKAPLGRIASSKITKLTSSDSEACFLLGLVEHATLVQACEADFGLGGKLDAVERLQPDRIGKAITHSGKALRRRAAGALG
jgi:hypothetical protein